MVNVIYTSHNINLSYNSKMAQHYTGKHEHSLCITVKMADINIFITEQGIIAVHIRMNLHIQYINTYILLFHTLCLCLYHIHRYWHPLVSSLLSDKTPQCKKAPLFSQFPETLRNIIQPIYSQSLSNFHQIN